MVVPCLALHQHLRAHTSGRAHCWAVDNTKPQLPLLLGMRSRATRGCTAVLSAQPHKQLLPPCPPCPSPPSHTLLCS